MNRRLWNGLIIFMIFVMTMCLATLSSLAEDAGVVEKKAMLVDRVTLRMPETELVDVTLDETVPESFEYQFDGTEDYSAWTGYWSVKNGYYGVVSRSNAYHGAIRNLTGVGDEFILELSMQFPQMEGNTCGLSLSMGDRSILIRMRPRDFFIHTAGGTYYSDELDLTNPEQWYHFKMESYQNKERVRIYIDGECVADVEPYRTNPGQQAMFYCYANGMPAGNSEMRMDWVKFTSITKEKTIDLFPEKSSYREGETVTLTATSKQEVSFPSVNYVLNGKTVAVGYPPEYRVDIPGLLAGTYDFTAEYDGNYSEEKKIEILPTISAQLKVEETTSQTLSVQLDECMNFDGIVSEVEFFVDGQSVGKKNNKPYHISINNISSETHYVAAVLKNERGVIVEEFTQRWIPQIKEEEISWNYSNEISYQVNGINGNAEIVLGNGTHLLTMRHTPYYFVCITEDGSEKVPCGVGEFTILTDGPFADIYQNGQLIVSILLPRNPVPQKKITEQGMTVSDFLVSIPENRGNYFVQRIDALASGSYPLYGANPWNNLDFVAGDADEVEFALNDGFYTTRIYMQGGSIYAWTVFEEKSPPEIKKICDVLPGAGNFYRIETTGGMARIYGNGKWLGSFRGILSVGSPELGVQINKGDGLSYLAVNDYTDRYLYRDNFNEKGPFSSLDYWRMTNMNGKTDANQGVLVLDAATKENAIAELNAYAGRSELSAVVTLRRCEGGFWFIINHSIEEEYTKVGYDATTGKFQVVDVTGNDSALTERILKEGKGYIPLNKSVQIDLDVFERNNGKEVVLFVDGKEVISHFESDYMLPMTQRGKIGIIMSKAVAELSSFSYDGDAKPLLQVNDTNPIPNQINTFDLIENQDGLVLVTDGYYLYSRDAGKTWQEKAADELQGVDVVRMDNGEILSVVLQNEEDGMVSFAAAVSTDGGRSYTRVGTVSGPQGPVTTTGNRVCQGASGRLYFVRANLCTENDGSVTVCYSTDYGRTWYESEEVDHVDVGGTVHEAKVIELEDGHCRMYFRSEFGSVMSIDSFDYGETWEEENPVMLPMFSAANAFNIEQDTEERNILYIGWPYDNANMGGMIQYPRTRWAVAKSTDWGENWEFIGTTMEYTRHEASVYNMGFNITSDYIVHNACGVADSGDDTPERYLTWGGRYIVMPREKQVSTKRFEQLHQRFPGQYIKQSVVSEDQKENTLVINTQTENILFRNELIKNAGHGEYVLATYGAAFVGAEMEIKEDETIAFSIGSHEVIFQQDAVITYQGENYLSLSALGNAYGLYLVEDNGLYILGKFPKWNARARRAFRIATDVLTDGLI